MHGILFNWPVPATCMHGVVKELVNEDVLTLALQGDGGGEGLPHQDKLINRCV